MRSTPGYSRVVVSVIMINMPATMPTILPTSAIPHRQFRQLSEYIFCSAALNILKLNHLQKYNTNSKCQNINKNINIILLAYGCLRVYFVKSGSFRYVAQLNIMCSIFDKQINDSEIISKYRHMRILIYELADILLLSVCV